VESGEWGVESGEWGVESGEWGVESGELGVRRMLNAIVAAEIIPQIR